MERPASQVVPLLPEQRRFLTRALPEAHHWNQVSLFRIPTELTAPIVATAMRLVVNRHEALRVRLTDASPCDVGALAPPLDTFPVEEVDLSTENDSDALTAYCTQVQASLRFDDPPMLRVSRITLNGGEVRLLVVAHHFVADGVGFGVLIGEFDAACRDLLAGRTPTEPRPTAGAHEFASWLTKKSREPDIVDQYETWLRLGQSAPAVPLQYDRENTMATTEIATVVMNRDETHALLRAAGTGGRSGGILDVFLTALIPTLTAGGDTRLRTNLIGHGRYGLAGQPRVARTVGWLSTRYPLHLALDGHADFATQREEVRRQLGEVPMSGTGFGLLRYVSDDPALREELARLGEPDVTVNYRGRTRAPEPDTLLQPADESPGPDETSTGLREHVHGVDLLVRADEMNVIWYYSANQFDADTVTRYATELCDRVRKGLGL
ncbi:condensation domain-containing protein [Micromonospora sp. DT46]|uniref:condensation domain-containing protein n=1 Tax=Micromonospora sp. DT46 TaxID=3393435 RepID=UPI003CF68C7F